MDKSKSLCSIYQYCSIIAGTNGISPIFLTTVELQVELVDLKTGQKLDSPRERCFFDEAGEATLEEVYSVATGTVLTINTKTKKLL
jgi:aconitate hydratase 2/2-methylisocitrate dehydratase